MKRKYWLVFSLVVIIVGTIAGLAAAITETEPNNTPAQANYLLNGDLMNGSIGSNGDDVDFFQIDGLNSTWGWVALLETDQSTISQDGVLTAYGSDGATVLQEDRGSWELGSGIALQNFTNGDGDYYLKVKEGGQDARITAYTLRFYQTVVRGQPETEPNETRATGNSSSFTQDGVLQSTVDKDCYQFHGRAADTILLALNGDPERNSSPVDPVLELVSPGDAILKSANQSGLGGKEFIEYGPLAEEGVYAYCVSVGAGTGGTGATYKAGIIRNGGLYFPSYLHGPTWLNPRPGNFALVGETLSIQVAITNTSPVSIPGGIDLKVTYPGACLEFLNANPTPSSSSAGVIQWEGLKPAGLAPGEAYAPLVHFKALAVCSNTIRQNTTVQYFFTGHGRDVFINTRSPLFLPFVKR